MSLTICHRPFQVIFSHNTHCCISASQISPEEYCCCMNTSKFYFPLASNSWYALHLFERGKSGWQSHQVHTFTRSTNICQVLWGSHQADEHAILPGFKCAQGLTRYGCESEGGWEGGRRKEEKEGREEGRGGSKSVPNRLEVMKQLPNR